MASPKNFVGQGLLKIEDGNIKDFYTAQTKYVIRNDGVTDFYGRTLFKLDGERIKDFAGRTLLTVSNNTVRTFSGQTVARFDSITIKNFSGQTQYRVDGFLSGREMMALIASIYAV